MKTIEIIEELEKLFPNAHCELNHETNYQLLVAVVLSAQTTDVRVNIVTKDLFKAYPDAESMMNADIKDIERLIKSIGLYKNKAKNVQLLSKQLVEEFNGVVPNTMEELTKLSGVGRKTANVVLSVCFDYPAIAVDTHVERISKRLKLAKEEDSVLEVEKSLMRKIPKKLWSRSHHLLIFFGRYKCFARNPNCEDCPFISFCRYQKELKSTKNKVK